MVHLDSVKYTNTMKKQQLQQFIKYSLMHNTIVFRIYNCIGGRQNIYLEGFFLKDMLNSRLLNLFN